jgi:hypothetical protein
MTLTLNGTNGITFPSGAVSNGIAAMGVVATTSGTTVDFTLPVTGVRRVSLLLGGVSTSGTNAMLLQIGPSGGVETSGYAGAGWDGSASYAHPSNGFSDNTALGANLREWFYTLMLLDPATNTWMAMLNGGLSNAAGSRFFSGRKAISGALAKIRLTTVGGTDTFDAGNVNLYYE